jgi:DNA-binding CsgD family transcriptional regulator/PAS domain-containing protein
MHFDRLIEQIYDAADEATGLDDVLQRAGAALGAVGGQAMCFADGALVQNHSYGGSPEGYADYSARWYPQDPRVPISMARFGEILSDVGVIDPDAFERSAVYNECLALNDHRYSMFVNARCGPGLVIAQCFLRRKQDEAFQRRDLERFGRLLPHFARALRLRQVIQTLRSENDDLRRALDRFAEAVFILDARGKTLAANAAAERVLGERDGLATERGHLIGRRADETRAIEVAVGRASALADARTVAPAPVVSIARDRRGALSLLFFPLRGRSPLRADAESRGRVLVLVHDPGAIVRFRPALVAALHGLTATEAELASCLAEGRSLADFAAERGCTAHTARTHMKRILEKTGTSRQAELVRLLVSAMCAHGVD